MTPKSLQNLNSFKSAYNQFGYYLLAPASIVKDGAPDIVIDYGIVKREIHFKEASEIGPNDIDIVLISPKNRPNKLKEGI